MSYLIVVGQSIIFNAKALFGRIAILDDRRLRYETFLCTIQCILLAMLIIPMKSNLTAL